jgi:hypothetical protein
MIGWLAHWANGRSLILYMMADGSMLCVFQRYWPLFFSCLVFVQFYFCVGSPYEKSFHIHVLFSGAC